MARDGNYHVYMLTNLARTVLYIGVTSDLEGRLYEHRVAETPSFTKTYHVNRLVYCEDYPNITAAIAREKQLKGWRRTKKDALIATLNPAWDDLSAQWQQR